jgi:hypothetical protein
MPVPWVIIEPCLILLASRHPEAFKVYEGCKGVPLEITSVLGMEATMTFEDCTDVSVAVFFQTQATLLWQSAIYQAPEYALKDILGWISYTVRGY